MKLIAFSDWRIQSIEKLIEFLQRLNEKPDYIIYAGDDIARFNKVGDRSRKDSVSSIIHRGEVDRYKNYFEEIAKFSVHGLLVVSGNDDLPFVRSAIRGKNVYNLHGQVVVNGDYAFIGLEGSTEPPGLLIYSEEDVWLYLNSMLKEVPPDKKIILVSHTPPYSLLDIGIRFGIRHIGSRSLKRFLDENVERIKMVICGHVHSQGGKTVKYKNCLVVNCASHDNEGELGKLAIIKVDKKVSVEWSYIYDERCEKLKEIRELKSIPLVGFSRAKILIKNGITNVFQVANLDDSHSLARHPSFEGSFELIVRYARAKVLGKPIIIGKHPFFRNIDSRNVYFFDAEYNSAGTKEGSYGIFLLGLMNSEGEIRQIFLDDPKYEKLLLEGFLEWVQKERPILISYSSKSADKPQLINSLKRFNLPTHTIENIFFDEFCFVSFFFRFIP